MQQTSIDHTHIKELLREYVLPCARKKGGREPVLRIWAVGCPQGNEAMTLMVGLHELLKNEQVDWNVTIFATDPDPVQVERARTYDFADPFAEQPFAREWQSFFERTPKGYRLMRRLRDHIIFGQHDLLSKMPFLRLDCIIWFASFAAFSPGQQTVILYRFAYALLPHGYLLLNVPTTVPPEKLYYTRVVEDQQLYQRTKQPITLRALSQAVYGTSKGLVQEPPSIDAIKEAYLEELKISLEERDAVCRELENRTVTLEQAYHDLEQLTLLKDDFLSLVSHELCTPVTIILSTAQMMQRLLHGEEAKNLTAEQIEHLKGQMKDNTNILVVQAKRMATLIGDMLDTARLRGDAFHLEKAGEVDIVALVRRIVEQQILLTSRSICVETEAEVLIGCWDESRIEQVMQNLLDNAIKYSKDSTNILVTIKKVLNANIGEEVLVAVQDEGYGIAPKAIPYLFDRFYQVRTQPGNPAQTRGLGLGLYITAEIVKRHGGRIWVESEQGVGSTFFVTLPLDCP